MFHGIAHSQKDFFALLGLKLATVKPQEQRPVHCDGVLFGDGGEGVRQTLLTFLAAALLQAIARRFHYTSQLRNARQHVWLLRGGVSAPEIACHPIRQSEREDGSQSSASSPGHACRLPL